MHLKLLLVYVLGQTIYKDVVWGTSTVKRSGNRTVRAVYVWYKLQWLTILGCSMWTHGNHKQNRYKIYTKGNEKVNILLQNIN